MKDTKRVKVPANTPYLTWLVRLTYGSHPYITCVVANINYCCDPHVTFIRGFKLVLKTTVSIELHIN